MVYLQVLASKTIVISCAISNYIIEIPDRLNEFQAGLFRLLIKFNKDHGAHRYDIFKNSNIRKIFDTWQLSDILLKTDNELFELSYKERYKNNPTELKKLPTYIIPKRGGTRRKQYARRRTKRQRMIQRTSRTKHRSNTTRGRLRKHRKKTKRTVIQG